MGAENKLPPETLHAVGLIVGTFPRTNLKSLLVAAEDDDEERLYRLVLQVSEAFKYQYETRNDLGPAPAITAEKKPTVDKALVLQTLTTTRDSMGATVVHLQWELLRKKDPDTYAQIAEVLNKMKEESKSEGQLAEEQRAEEQKAEEEAEAEELLENEEDESENDYLDELDEEDLEDLEDDDD